ncbi:hypothetical protein B0H13DRAFT_1867896 [Mycena leptocephala]|nr:hypothetical protein B0H13DRAFT_1867896 [Mycena leptocephala]
MKQAQIHVYYKWYDKNVFTGTMEVGPEAHWQPEKSVFTCTCTRGALPELAFGLMSTRWNFRGTWDDDKPGPDATASAVRWGGGEDGERRSRPRAGGGVFCVSRKVRATGGPGQNGAWGGSGRRRAWRGPGPPPPPPSGDFLLLLASRAIQIRVAVVKTKLLDGFNFRSMLWAFVSVKMSSREFFLNSQQDSEQICRPTMSKKWGGLEHSKRDHIQIWPPSTTLRGLDLPYQRLPNDDARGPGNSSARGRKKQFRLHTTLTQPFPMASR